MALGLPLAKGGLPLSVCVIVSSKNGVPCVELRRVTQDDSIIRLLVSCAFHEQPLIVLPMFSDKMQSLASLIEKGIIYRKGQQFFFVR